MRYLKLLFIILFFPIWLVETKHFLTQAYKAPHDLSVYFQTSHSCDHFAWANMLSKQLGFLPLRPCFVTITLGAFHTHLHSYLHPLRHSPICRPPPLGSLPVKLCLFGTLTPALSFHGDTTPSWVLGGHICAHTSSHCWSVCWGRS